jgi:hypothetical protein
VSIQDFLINLVFWSYWHHDNFLTLQNVTYPPSNKVVGTWFDLQGQPIANQHIAERQINRLKLLRIQKYCEVKMPKLAQVGNHQKRETVDARDHASCKTVHCGCSQTGFSTTWGLEHKRPRALWVIQGLLETLLMASKVCSKGASKAA